MLILFSISLKLAHPLSQHIAFSLTREPHTITVFVKFRIKQGNKIKIALSLLTRGNYSS